MSMLENYRPENITPSMRKYLGVECAKDEGTSEGAKKGWEHRKHGGGGGASNESGEWDNYVDVDALRKDLGDLNTYISDSEIGELVDFWRGDDTPESAREAVYQTVHERASERYDKDMASKYRGNRYDSIGAPNW